MKKAWSLIIFGLALTFFGVVGLALFYGEVQRHQQESRAAAAQEIRRQTEQAAVTEELKRQIDEERVRALQARLNLLNEEKLRNEEAARHKREIEELEGRIKQRHSASTPPKSTSVAGPVVSAHKSPYTPKKSGERPKAPQSPAKSNPEEISDTALKRSPAQGTVTLRVNLDAFTPPEIRVAHVHMGDKVSVRVKRRNGADETVYVGLAPLSFFADASPKMRWPGWGTPPSLVIMPVRDRDGFKILPPHHIDRDLVGAMSSRDGAILTIGVESRGRRGMGRHGASFPEGAYQVEITIEADNRWDISPRSLI